MTFFFIPKRQTNGSFVLCVQNRHDFCVPHVCPLQVDNGNEKTVERVTVLSWVPSPHSGKYRANGSFLSSTISSGTPS